MQRHADAVGEVLARVASQIVGVVDFRVTVEAVEGHEDAVGAGVRFVGGVSGHGFTVMLMWMV